MSLVAKYKFRPMNMLFTALGGLGSVCYGYNAMVISSTLAQPSFIHYMGLDQREDANDLIGLTGSLFQLGGFIGTFFISFFADRWGRRVGLAVPAAMLVVSAAILAGSVHIGMFIAGRFLAGAGACMIVSAVTLWISEIVPPKVRGSFVNVNGASILIGGAMSAWIGYGFGQLHPGDLDSNQWRAPLALAALPPLVLLSFLSWLPESPRWLVKEGRDEDAKRALSRLCVPEEAADEFLQIHLQLEHDRHLESSYMSILTKPSYRKRAILAMLTTISTQMTGPLVIVNYGPIIYSTLGFDTNKQLIYQAGWILTGLAGGLISLFIVDMISRPKLFAVGIVGSVTMLAIEAALVATYAPNPEALENPNTAALQAAVAMFYVSSVLHSYRPVTFLEFKSVPNITCIGLYPLLRGHPPRSSICVLGRNLPHASASKGRWHRYSSSLCHQHHVAPGCTHSIRQYRLEILPLLHHSRHSYGNHDSDFLA